MLHVKKDFVVIYSSMVRGEVKLTYVVMGGYENWNRIGTSGGRREADVIN